MGSSMSLRPPCTRKNRRRVLAIAALASAIAAQASGETAMPPLLDEPSLNLSGEGISFQESPKQVDDISHGVTAKRTVADLVQFPLALVGVIGDGAQHEGFFGIN